MPLYLWQGSYTPSGAEGLRKDGGTKREQAVRQMIEQAGGKLHAFYFCLGDTDVIGIAEFPDHATGVGLSLIVNAAGAANIRSTLLIPPSEVDKAAKVNVGYRAPGG